MSPSFLYISVWSFIIFLYSLEIVGFYEELTFDFLLIQMIIFLVLLVSEILIAAIYKKRRAQHHLKEAYQRRKLNQVLVRMRPLLVLMFIVDVIYSGGFPLFWILSGDSRSHIDFGMPTFHGLFHGLLLFFVTSSFLQYRLGFNERQQIVNIFCFFLYVVIVFNRGLTFIFLIQALFMFFITGGRLRVRNFYKFSLALVIGVYIFGELGNIRMGSNVFLTAISGEGSYLFDYLPASLIWFYVYATGGLNNLLYNLSSLEPSYYPVYTLAKLIPTVGYDLLGLEKAYDSFELVDGRITVSTAFQGLVSDFGLYGMFLYLPVLLGAQFAYRKARLLSIKAMLLYSMLMQTIVMTPYIDTVFYLTFMLQLVLVWSISVRYSKLGVPPPS
jgi:oligosaccharide repeat unit polymerase